MGDLEFDQETEKMDIIFRQTQGESFTIEVGFFDTILEIKQKVEKYREIPVSDQKLIFNGEVLPDDLNIHDSDILNRSIIHLHLPSDEPIMPARKILLLFKMPPPKAVIKVEMSTDETIHRVKAKIQEIEGIPVARLVFSSKGVELSDHKTLQESGIGENGVIDVIVKPTSAAVAAAAAAAAAASKSSSGSGASTSGRSRKKMRIWVVTKSGGEKTPVEVNQNETVAELKKKLENVEIDLPKEGYFFIYKQNVMDDDKSFKWHRVGQGDSIEVFGGTVSRGT